MAWDCFYGVLPRRHRSWNRLSARQPDTTAAVVKDRVFLEAANELEFNELITPDFQILRGDVRFRKDSMYMYCDSAYFYEKTNSLDAFGNVRMGTGRYPVYLWR